MAQLLRPSSDVQTTGWSRSSGTNSYYTYVDETSADSADYLFVAGSTAEIILGFSAGSTPGAGTVTLRAQLWSSGGSGAPERYFLRLLEGATEIATSGQQTLTRNTPTTVEITASTASISSWSTLRVGVAGGSLGGSEQIRFGWAELEIPDASTNYPLAAGNGSIAVSGKDATLQFTRNNQFTAENGSIAVSGKDATLSYGAASTNYPLAAEDGTLSLTGQAAALSRQYALAAEDGTFAQTGQVVALSERYHLAAEDGTFALTGQDAGLSAGAPGINYPITAARGRLTLSGVRAVTRYSFPIGTLLDVDTTGATSGRDLSFDGSQWRPGTFSQLIATAGTFTLTGQSAATARGNAIDAAAGSFSLTGNDAAIEYVPSSINYPLAADAGTFAVTGQAAALRRGYFLAATTGTLAITGQDATLGRQYVTTAEAGAYSLTGQAISVTRTYTITAAQGTFTVTGGTAGLSIGQSITAATGSLALTGQVVTLSRGYAITAAAGSFTLTGNDAVGIKSGGLTAELGAFTISGKDAALGGLLELIAVTGSFTLTGGAATTVRNVSITAARGRFTFQGIRNVTRYSFPLGALLDVDTTGATNGTELSFDGTQWRVGNFRQLIAARGTFSLTGRPAVTARGNRIEADRGSFTLTGRPATLDYSAGINEYTLAADRGTFTLSGKDASLQYGLGVTAERGTFALTGQPVTLQRNNGLTADRGVFILAGQDASLGAGERVTAEIGALTLTGQPAAFQVAYHVTADRGAFTLNGRPAALEYISGQQPYNARPPEYIGGSAVVSSQLVLSLSLAGTGWQPGDLCLAVLETANQTISIPGFTDAPTSPQSQGTPGAAGGVRLTVLYRWLQAGDSGFIATDSGDHQIGYLAVFRYVSPTDPFNASAGTTLAASRDVTCPQVTTTKNNCLLVNILATDRDADSTNNFATRANNQWTNDLLTELLERADEGTKRGTGGGIALATGIQPASGLSGSTTVGQGQSAALCAITLALSPSGNAYNLTAGRGQFLLNGRPTIGKPFYNLRPERGVFELTGYDIRPQPFYNLRPETGQFLLNGRPIGLDFSRGSVEYGALCETGTFTLDGNPITEQFSTGLAAERGEFTYQGYDPFTIGPVAYTIDLLVGTFIWQGQPITASKGKRITAAREQFSMVGYTIEINRQRNLAASTGTIVLDGKRAYTRDSSKRRRFAFMP